MTTGWNSLEGVLPCFVPWRLPRPLESKLFLLRLLLFVAADASSDVDPGTGADDSTLRCFVSRWLLWPPESKLSIRVSISASALRFLLPMLVVLSVVDASLAPNVPKGSIFSSDPKLKGLINLFFALLRC